MRLSKMDRLLDSFQGNAYPSMIADFAQHLGVGESSLRMLGVGYAPHVPFKKADNFDGWWANPERDADAKVVGLSLRFLSASGNDAKVMYPGSNHGLIYAVNPDHRAGERGYSAGPHNWVRTMDAGHLCPICGKPDGCLLSVDNPADPTSVVCLRVSDGSVRPLRLGFLHLRKEAGFLRHASALAPGREHPLVLVVEGMSDTAAALDMGFAGLGRPSNLACMDMVRDILRGHEDVVFLGENDRKGNRWPGRDGMLAAFAAAKHVCKNPRMLLPPPEYKDLRAWVVRGGLDAKGLLEYLNKNAILDNESDLIEDDLPDTVAQAFLDHNFKLASHYTLRRWEQEWYRFGANRYQKIKDEELFPTLHDWAKLKKVQTGKDDPPIKKLRIKFQQIEEHLIAKVLVGHEAMPCWVNGSNGPDPKDCVVFANGILNVSEYFSGAVDSFLDPTPDLFTVSALPTVFDTTAVCPTWLSFLQSSLGDEPQKISLLQEWMGYLLTPDTSFQKMMFFRGPTAAGKSRILDVIHDVLGRAQVAAPVFADLKDFGLNALVGKLAVLIGDARTPAKSQDQTGLETLLRITGNDAVMINRKGISHLEAVHLTCRITMASNGFLDVADHYGAMLRRLLIIDFTRSFKGQEDYSLPARLAGETQGITLWALEGLRRLRSQGCFTIPASMVAALEEWRRGASPLASFLSECCEEKAELHVGKKELFDAWSAWAAEHRIYPPSFQKFLEWVRANASTVSVQGDHFIGITLKEWAAKRYLGKP